MTSKFNWMLITSNKPCYCGTLVVLDGHDKNNLHKSIKYFPKKELPPTEFHKNSTKKTNYLIFVKAVQILLRENGKKK